LSNSKDISISKEVLPELPNDYQETSLGDRRGAKKQYRSTSTSSSGNLHAREYDNKFTIHIDQEDPRRNPIGHLVKDAPETIAAAATTMYIAKRKFGKSTKLSTAQDNSGFLSGGGLIGTLLLSFIALNSVFRILKTILFG
jgi:hypothetical protein